MKRRNLVTTNLIKTWGDRENILFLGSWCVKKEYFQKLKKFNFEIASTPKILKSISAESVERINTVEKQLFPELASKLNTFHQSNYSHEFWNIIIGHWLQRYLAAIFFRYELLNSCLQNYDISETFEIKINKDELIPSNSKNFILNSNSSMWNHQIYASMLRDFGVNVKTIQCDKQEKTGLNANEEYFVKADKKKQFFAKLFSKFANDRDPVIVGTYFEKKYEKYIQIQNKCFPQFWEYFTSDETSVPSIISKKRNDIFGANKVECSFESFCKKYIEVSIPKSYLEDFNTHLHHATHLPLPKKPKFIFTANFFDTDETFKTWIASKIENKIPYFVAQHGANYGTHVYFGNDFWPERKFAQKFFSWGWTDESKQTHPIGNQLVYKKNLKQKVSREKLLIVKHCGHHEIIPADPYFKSLQELKMLNKLRDGLNPEINQNTVLRLHPSEGYFQRHLIYGFSDPKTIFKYEAGKKDIYSLFSASKVVLFTHDSTGFLELLALAHPTLMFLENNLNEVHPKALKYYLNLKKVGIIHTNAESLICHLNMHWQHFDDWWQTEKVKLARERFVENYSRNDSNTLLKTCEILKL